MDEDVEMIDTQVEPEVPAVEAHVADETTSSSKAAPKFTYKRTLKAIKKQKSLPTFTQGEMFPWKGVWFRVVGTTEAGLVINPVTEQVTEQVKEVATHAK